jgi:hypothetical protein
VRRPALKLLHAGFNRVVFEVLEKLLLTDAASGASKFEHRTRPVVRKQPQAGQLVLIEQFMNMSKLARNLPPKSGPFCRIGRGRKGPPSVSGWDRHFGHEELRKAKVGLSHSP